MQFKRKLVYSLILPILASSTVFASPDAERTFSTDIVKTQEPFSENNAFKAALSGAVSKFENLNIKIAYDDLHKLITASGKKNDFYLLVLGDKTAELGFFDLSNLAFSKIKDVDISAVNVEEVKKFYYPAKSMPKADTLILAELYSDIVYNDRAKESVTELSQYPRLLRDYDWANYVMALGYFKLNDTANAKKHIDTAIRANSANINYKILESKIVSNEKKGKLSKKIIKDIRLQNFETASLVNKINAAEEYTYYLISKKSFDKDFHLGRYYFAEKDYVKAARVFQGAVGKNKKHNANLYSMLARCYFELGDYSKSTEYTEKTCKITGANPDCLIAMGDLKAKQGDLKTAVKYYKSAAHAKHVRQTALEKTASAYTKIYGAKRGLDIYKDILKEYKNSYAAYYRLGLEGGERETDYLKKSVSLNIRYQDGWIDLARVMLEKGNIDLAKNYLAVANYLDENNFRYYYYQSLIKKKEAEFNNSQNNRIHKVADETQHTHS